MLGVLANSGAVLVGGVIGLLFREKIKEKYTTALMAALALVSLGLGIICVVGTADTLCLILCTSVGTLIGELLRIDDRVEALGALAERKLSKSEGGFAQAFVSCSILFCVGSMAVMGSVEAGINGNNSILYAKAVLDFVAALAFGTQSVPRVDKIVGPGNIYVATAKQLCYARGLCDIDMVAGPSEIMIVSDANTSPVHLAADLLSQAEHDRLSSAWLAVTDASLAEAVASEVERQLKLLPREEIARASIEQNGRILVVDSLETAARLADEIAPEHLELCVDDPFGLLPMVHNAGSVFLGRSCPEPLGDYLAGPNHTLPTSGTARYSSPLGVDDFCRRSSYLYYTPDALGQVSEDVMRFARREGLDAHANAVAVRMEGRS